MGSHLIGSRKARERKASAKSGEWRIHEIAAEKSEEGGVFRMTSEVTIKNLMAKAKGFTISIEKMDEKQRANTPSGQYGEDYNKLLGFVGKLCPNLIELLPPRVGTRHGSSGHITYSEQSFGEINTYCEQIYQLLSEQG